MKTAHVDLPHELCTYMYVLMGSNPVQGSQIFFENDCLGQVVLCCFSFNSVVLLLPALPF